MQYFFEFDEAKSVVNRAKHGIDFIQAQGIWLDDDLLRIPARSEGERRYLFIGMIGDRCWSAIATYRGEVIRIISARRSRAREVDAYEDRRAGQEVR